MTYTEEDIGKVVSYEGHNGTLRDERIVLVYCQPVLPNLLGRLEKPVDFLERMNCSTIGSLPL